MACTISPDIQSAQPTPSDEELAIDVELEDIEDVEDVETTTRIPVEEAQRLVDAAFGPRP
jgi:hypothetical protein